MSGFLVFCFAGLAVVCAVHGFTVQERFTEVIADFDNDVAAKAELTKHSGCLCHHSVCVCHGVDDGLEIYVIITVVEFRRSSYKHVLIEAKFFIGHEMFLKLFPADRIEDFCHTVKHKRFCFRIDIHDNSTGGLLRGCLGLSRPKKLDMGCFNLPLLTSESEEMRSEEDAEDNSDVLLNSADSSETFAGKTDVMDDSLTGMPEYRAVAEMQVPAESDFDNDVAVKAELTKHSGCFCHHSVCVCHGVDDGLEIYVIITVVEFRKSSYKHVLIEAKFFIGHEMFLKLFPADRIEDFCHTVKHKRFCFRIDIHDNSTGGLLRGCLGLSRPKKLDMGCFNLPLLTSESEEMRSEEDADDNSDVLLNSADSSETFAGKTDVMDDSLTGMPEYRAVAEMQVPAESDSMKKISDCTCSKYVCYCQGNDDGYKVSVLFIVNEVRHGDHNHTRIQATFRVDKSVFFKSVDVEQFDDFCKTMYGKEFCFDIDVSKVCGTKIHGCIGLTKPKEIRLGCFNIPLLTSHLDSDITCDDE